MKFNELKKSLTDNLSLIYLVEGEDAFLRENAVRLIKQKALSEPDLNLTNLSGQEVKEDPEALLTATQSYPFMSERRYVVVRDYYPTAQELKGKVISKVFLEPSETTVVIIVNDRTSEPLKKLSNVTVVDCAKADEATISAWVRNRALASNVVIGSDALRTLIDYCNVDMTRISGETDKLISFVGENSEITVTAVQELVGKETEYQVYELTETVARKNNGKAFDILTEMLNKNQDKQRLFISIYYHFRRLLHASVSSSSIQELAENLGIKEFAAKKAKEQAMKFKVKRLKQICDKLARYDGDFKSGEISVDTALWNSILNAMISE